MASEGEVGLAEGLEGVVQKVVSMKVVGETKRSASSSTMKVHVARCKERHFWVCSASNVERSTVLWSHGTGWLGLAIIKDMQVSWRVFTS